MNRMLFALRMLILSAALTVLPQARADSDWTYWVGPRFTGVSGAKNLPEKWNPRGGEGSHVLWTNETGCRSTPVLMGGKLYLITNSHEDDIRQAGEKVVCIDAQSGETVWEHEFNVYLTDVPIERVGWSSVVADPRTGNVFAQGVCGYFCCLNGQTGELVWSRSMSEEFGFLSTYGGRTNHPIVHEKNVIISAVVIGWGETAKPTHRFLAMDTTNGQTIWMEGTRTFPYDTTYSAPVLAVIDGELQMIFASGDGGVHSIQPRTGRKLWSYNLSRHGVNNTPLVVGNRVYIGHAEENLDTTRMGALICIDATRRGDITGDGAIWKKYEYFVSRSSPIHIDGRIYVADDRAKLHCLDAETGEAIGSPVRMGTMMRANLLYADGKIYAHELNGRGFVLKPTDKGAETLHQFRFGNGEECHASPIAANGRIYIPTTEKLYCVGHADNDQPDAELPPPPEEQTVADNDAPASLQLVPVENLLRPGYRQPLQARVYNDRGQYLRTAEPGEVAFSNEGPGHIQEHGEYVVNSHEPGHAAAVLTAKLGALSAQARVRVVPPLDWSFDFNDGKVPETWVACSYRHVAMDWDLLTKLREEDSLTGDLYIYLMTEFANFGPQRDFDDSTPQERWKKFLEFFNLADSADKPKTVAEAQAKFDPALQKLVDEKILGRFEWTTWDRKTGSGDQTVPEPKLIVEQGERKIDGNGVLCKITTIPLGTRSQGWMGHPDLHDYTIQSDVYCFSRLDKLPDAGLIAQRYTLDLMGASQQLQIRTWTPQLNRFSKTVPFEWKPETWYTMKFQAANENGKAVLKGKVWRRGEAEPEDWTITAEDPAPNTVGSPGLFGNSKDGEVFYDNLTVTGNAVE